IKHSALQVPGNALNQAGETHGSDNDAGLATLTHQMLQQQAEDFMAAQKSSSLVNHSQAVTVAIKGKSKAVLAIKLHQLAQLVELLLNRLGFVSFKQGIFRHSQLRLDREMLAKQIAVNHRPGTMHVVNCNVLLAATFPLGSLQDSLAIFLLQVKLHRIRQMATQVEPGDVVITDIIGSALNLVDILRQHASAVCSFELYAAVIPGIM